MGKAKTRGGGRGKRKRKGAHRKAGDDDDRAKDFFTPEVVFSRHVGDDRRGEERALGEVVSVEWRWTHHALTSSENFAHSPLHEGLNAFELAH